jgi:TPP-dependent pyruvate/acetoin dehydrogenase alpha subunit
MQALTDRDPLPAWHAVLLSTYDVAADELASLDARIAAEVTAAAEEAERMPLSDPAGLTRFVWPEGRR